MQRLTLLQRRRSRVFAVVFSIAVTTFPLAACAQSEGAAQSSPADKLFDEAGAAMDAGDYATACPKIEQVVRMRPDGLGAKVKLAKCYEGAGRLASAWALWRQIEPLAENAKQLDRQKEAQQRAQELAPKLASLAIVVPGAVRALPGLEITRDGKVIDPAQWGVPVPVDKGRHVIGVTATGRGRSEEVEEVEADGMAKAVLVDPPGAVGPPAPPVAPAEPKRSVVPVVVLGVLAVGGIASGIGFSALSTSNNQAAIARRATLSAREEDPDHCLSGGCPYANDPTFQSYTKAAGTFQGAAVGSFVVGGAAAAGTVVYLLWPSPRWNGAPLAPVVGGIAAGGLVAGIAFSVLLVGANSEATTAYKMIVARSGTCLPNVGGYDSLWCPQLVSAQNAALIFHDALVGTFVVGGAAAAGTALYLLWPSLRSNTAEPPAVRDVRLTPIPARNGGGLVLSGSF
jgi:hypothetical protein